MLGWKGIATLKNTPKNKGQKVISKPGHVLGVACLAENWISSSIIFLNISSLNMTVEAFFELT